MPLLRPMFRCRHLGDDRPRLRVVLLRVPVGLKVDQKVVVPAGIWVDKCHDDGLLDSDCCSNFPKCHQRLVWE